MKIVWYTFLVFLFFTVPSYAQTIEVENTGVTFVAPQGLKPLSQQIIKRKWPNRNAPKFAIGNERATTTVAYDLKPHAIPQDRMEEVRQSFTNTFNRVIPGIKWIKNEIIVKEGRKWLFLELSSSAIDTDIHNIMLMTGYKDKMLIFNFNSTKKDFPKYEKELRNSIQSIRLPK